MPFVRSKLVVLLCFCALLAPLAVPTVGAQTIDPSRGADARVDYDSLTRFGPWDDRNYQLTQDDLALLAKNEHEQLDPIPAFYRVELRKQFPQIRREGPAQYPLSALNRYLIKYGGYQIDGQLYRGVRRADGRFVVEVEKGPGVYEEYEKGGLIGGMTFESRVTMPNGAAESAVVFNPTNTNRVIAGTNGPGGGQKMHWSSDGGATWTEVGLPLGNTCCDPTMVYSVDGSTAWSSTLPGDFDGIWVYRSTNDGESWDDFPGDRVQVSSGFGDKQLLHLDDAAGSPHVGNIYLTWHEFNVMLFGRSLDGGETWATQTVSSGGAESGVGSDITSDGAGNIYYFWPAFNSRKIWMRKSTDGGVTFEPTVEVADTNASFNFFIPSQNSRGVAVIVHADADRTGGPFNGNVYAIWTDATTGAKNQARVQVGVSSDGGATWTLTTPHATDDVETIDRWQPYIRVAPDGAVHVIYNDTRNDPTRVGIDVYHTISTDGGMTWSTPTRLTTETSRSPGDGFEFGDYSGLDIVFDQLIAIFTDNRNEGGGSGDSKDVYVAGTTIGNSSVFTDGFESGDTTAWSSETP